MTTANENAHSTLFLLEQRLRRLEYILGASFADDGVSGTTTKPSADQTIVARLSILEDALRRLTAKSSLAQDVLRLYSRFPELFPVGASYNATPTDMGVAAAVVLAHATQFPETASKLSSLETLPVPDATATSHLLELEDRVKQATERQTTQAAEIAELRINSVRILQWWIEVGAVGFSECFVDWDERVQDCSRAVAVMENRSARDQV